MNSAERVADAGAVSSIFIWLTSHALQWMPILQAVSLMVAIVAGTFAIVFHIIKLWERFR